MSDRRPDDWQSRFPSPHKGRDERPVDAGARLPASYEPTEEDASTAFNRGMYAAGIRLAQGRLDGQETPSADSPEGFVRKILAERGDMQLEKQSGDAASRLLAKREKGTPDKGFAP